MGYRCIGPTVTPAKIEKLRRAVASDTQLQQARALLAVLSGKTRSAILYLLTQESELCVCDMADILDTTVSAVSHQLRALREAELVRTRRDEQTIFYALSDRGQAAMRGYYGLALPESAWR
jgi:DNA-binding transcriptional ArsR family regulator